MYSSGSLFFVPNELYKQKNTDAGLCLNPDGDNYSEGCAELVSYFKHSTRDNILSAFVKQNYSRSDNGYSM